MSRFSSSRALELIARWTLATCPTRSPSPGGPGSSLLPRNRSTACLRSRRRREGSLAPPEPELDGGGRTRTDTRQRPATTTGSFASLDSLHALSARKWWFNSHMYQRLYINIDHVATLRQARRTVEPDPVLAATECENAGADGITAHLREDRRHIQDDDVERLTTTVRTVLNLGDGVHRRNGRRSRPDSDPTR